MATRTTTYYHNMREELAISRKLLDDIEAAGVMLPSWIRKLRKTRRLKPQGKLGRPKIQARKSRDGGRAK